MADFTGGIQQQSNGVTLPILGSGLGGSVITVPDKPTAALEFLPDGTLSTRACYGLPSGGLSGLPSPQKFGTNPLTTSANPPNAGVNVNILGILTIDSGLINGNSPSTIALFKMYSSGANPWAEIDLVNGGAYSVLYAPTTIATSPSYPPTSPFVCYMNEVGVITPAVGFQPSVADGLTIFSASHSGYLHIGQNRRGYFFSHQGRVILVEAQLPTFVAGSINCNYISFTDPPETSTLGSQLELFFTNSLDAITSWGSLSSGELLLLTSDSGGIVVANDIFSPYITAVPGVQGTGGMYGKSCVSPIGLVYMSSQGAWSWSGGSNSQRISTSLAPNFATFGGSISLAQFEVSNYGDWIVFPGNWMYDTIGGGWWILNDPFIHDSVNYYNFHYTLGNNNAVNPGAQQSLFATPSGSLPSSNQFMISYTLPVCASAWRYTSNPILVDHGMEVDCREVVVTARNVGGFVYTINLQLMTAQGTVITLDPIVVPAHQVKMTQYRVQCYAQSDLIQFKLDVTSTDPNNTDGQNFTIGSVALGYLTRWHLPVT